MSVGRILVKVNLKSLLDKTIIVEKVEIEKPQITYELLSLTQNNVSQLLETSNKTRLPPTKKPQRKKKRLMTENQPATRSKTAKKSSSAT